MALVKYIGPYPEVIVPDAKNQLVKKGHSIETTTEVAASLLLDAADWEAGDEETRELEPGPPEEPTRTVTADYTIGGVLQSLFANATSKNLKVTVPTAVSSKGRSIYIGNTATNTNSVTLIAAGGNIKGEGIAPEKEVAIGKSHAYTGVTIVSDGTDWNVT